MKKNTLLTGTLLLTGAGLVSRFIGFFYRIFLSRMFGAEGMGIYELIHPVSALVFALCASGIQNAISKYVAGEPEEGGKRNRLRILLTGLFFSCGLSMVCSLLVYRYSDLIAAGFFMEKRCAPLLRIVALSFPAACIHSCINGYYYGIRKTALPAFCQLFEQTFRVGSVFLFWNYAQKTGVTFTITVAAVGLVIGEFSALAVSVPLTWWHFSKDSIKKNRRLPVLPIPSTRTGCASIARRILLFAAPLALNRVCLNLLSTVEAAWIPVKLQQFGCSNANALSIYGVLTGMAMTCILFPSALTNSVAVLLMPLIAQADATCNRPAIRNAILKCVRYCLTLGFAALALFFLSGDFMGNLLFHNSLAGHFIRTLSFICPFLYLNTTLFSILNGLGKTALTFTLNLCALLVRLAFVFFLIPLFGIKGYLWGLLASQLFMTLSAFYALRSHMRI